MKKGTETEITSSKAPASVTPQIQYQGSGFQYTPTRETVKDRVEKWFIKPLRKMDRDSGFIIICILFPLYEKHLKFADARHFTRSDKFHKGHPIFKVIGKDLNLSEEIAFEFWQHFRNGLEHRAMPQTSDGIRWQMGKIGKPVYFENGVFHVDPMELRDHLLNIIEQDLRMWKDDGVGFPLIYEIME